MNLEKQKHISMLMKIILVSQKMNTPLSCWCFLHNEHVTYFKKEKYVKNSIFFNRFPDQKYEGLKILDFGCGHGALSIDLALKGADKVFGVDIDKERVDFAQENLKANFPNLADKVTFSCTDFQTISADDFDIIISKATFEHIVDLEILLVEMKNKLKIGGKIISGFGPLYNSPWGDHNRLKHFLPWTHIIFKEKYFFKKLNKYRANKITNIYDLGLNGYSLKKYRTIFGGVEGLVLSDFRTNVASFKKNPEKNIAMSIFNLFANIPFLREYFTYNIYCTLERVK